MQMSGQVVRALSPSLLLIAAPLNARELDGAAILARAAKAAGGGEWANAHTLVLKGRAEFFGQSGALPRSTADSYKI